MQALHFSFAVGALTAPLLARPFISPAPHSIPAPTLTENSTTTDSLSLASSFDNVTGVEDFTVPTSSSPDVVASTAMSHVFTGTFQYAYFISCIPLLVAGATFMFFAYRRHSYRTVLKAQGLDSMEPGSPSADGGDDEATKTPVARWSFWRQWEFLLLLALFFCLYVGQEVSYGGFVFAYGVKGPVKMDSASAAELTAVYWGFVAVGRGLAIPLAWLKVPPGVMLIGDLLGSVVAAIFLLSVPSSSMVLWVFTALMGLSLASVFPTAISWGGQYMTFTSRSATVFVIGAALGEMVVPLLVGNLGPLSLMRVSLGIILSACAVFAFMFLRVHFHEKLIVKHAVRLDVEMSRLDTQSTNGKAKFLIDSDSDL